MKKKIILTCKKIIFTSFLESSSNKKMFFCDFFLTLSCFKTFLFYFFIKSDLCRSHF
ncbi:hypothetical protein HanIR_Chr09g0407961 [Helianthus annuus]|nr:hypothetical protein HanIR_Chr09g0407961 [Helianthus annuus]